MFESSGPAKLYKYKGEFPVVNFITIDTTKVITIDTTYLQFLITNRVLTIMPSREKRERFRCRKNNFVKKAAELSHVFGVEILVIIKQNDKYHTFNKDGFEIPSDEEWVSTNVRLIEKRN